MSKQEREALSKSLMGPVDLHDGNSSGAVIHLEFLKGVGFVPDPNYCSKCIGLGYCRCEIACNE